MARLFISYAHDDEVNRTTRRGPSGTVAFAIGRHAAQCRPRVKVRRPALCALGSAARARKHFGCASVARQTQ